MNQTDELFTHVKNLKKVLLVANGRSGSDFFQSLLDGHPQILQFTGIWYFHQWWKEAKCKENLADLVNEFIWHSCPDCNHIAKFKSYYNKEERWDQLGNNKNEFFEVSTETFRDHMLNILNSKELNSHNFFLAVNLAYGLVAGIDIKKTKIIFYHLHHIDKIKEFKQDFPDFEVICTIREPRNTLVSGIEHWKKYNIETYKPNFLYALLNRIFEESEPLLKYKNNFKVLKLEDLHLSPREVLTGFSMDNGLEFKECMLESTYHSKKWWGDALSGKYLDGFNKNIKEGKWKDKLFFYDNLLIEFMFEDRLKHYQYPLKNKTSKIYLIPVFFLVFLPMKYELKMLAYNFNCAATLRSKAAALCQSLFFYALRIILYFKYTGKKINGKIFLADKIS